MTTERKLWWATNSLFGRRPLHLCRRCYAFHWIHGGRASRHWQRFHSHADKCLVLLRYKSRIAAALFVLLGFIGFAVGMIFLISGTSMWRLHRSCFLARTLRLPFGRLML